MLLDHALALLETAATPSYERIRSDVSRLRPKLRPLLARLEEELFSPDLTVGNLLQACGIRDHSASTQFRLDIGVAPHQYFSARRMETAGRLLSESDLAVSDIAGLVGFVDLSSFSRAFKRWARLRPLAYRRQSEHEEGIGFLEPEAAPGTDASRCFLESLPAFTPRLPTEKDSAAPKLVIDGRDYEAFMAEQVWQRIAGSQPEEQSRYVRERVAFSSPVLFELISRRSREEGRRDRQLGVELAGLALESLEGSAEALGADATANYRAQAWAQIGNARRLAHDLVGADEAFAMADEIWNQTRAIYDPQVEAEIAFLKSALRLTQRRFEESLEQVELSLALARDAGDPALLTRDLMQRANVLVYCGEPSGGLRDLLEALDLAQQAENGYLELSIQTSLITPYTLLDRYNDAEHAVAAAQRLNRKFDQPVIECQIEWGRGLLHQALDEHDAAASALSSARAGLSRLGEMDIAAVASLDLALTYARQGRREALLQTVAEALPVFEALRVEREYLAGVKLLREAFEARELEQTLLRELRGQLESALLVPPSPN